MKGFSCGIGLWYFYSVKLFFRLAHWPNGMFAVASGFLPVPALKGRRMNADGQAPHILVINDSPEILALKREIFEDEGFRVTTWDTSEAELDKIIQIAPDLIILDYSSETESGLLQQLSTDPRTERIPLVLCTGARRQVEEMKPDLDAMGVAVVYKPFDIEDLVQTVREGLGLASESQESLPPTYE
jgi:two-component system response regulator VicR